YNGTDYSATHGTDSALSSPFQSLERNSSYELYQYQHFNKLPRKEGEVCPFCRLSRRVEIICETATCVAFYDGYPVSPGHALIVPKRHVASYFDLTNHEREAMNVVLQYVKQKVDERYHPDGYNVGINVNEAAGQSVFHLHMHLIPRYKGDVPNPKGGVRGVIPSKQSYDANEGLSSPAQPESK
ncbi:HIT family protein, partial [Phocaeicola plebeius]|uniref:HIT family protein n=1 Tax=Phocaeicola plebeius TaxID=310297 RepID=UPI00266CC4A4